MSEPSAPGARPVLLVVGDSLTHHGPRAAMPANDPRIWPMLVATELGWDLELVARIGWTNRDAWWAMTQDPRVWAAIPRAGAMVLATGGMDSLPSPLPTALREQLRYLRPPWLRRIARAAYGRAQPRLSPLGWPTALPNRLSVEYAESIRDAVTALRPELPFVATLPPTHRSAAYGGVHPGWDSAMAAVTRWGSDHDVPLVDSAKVTRGHIDRGEANIDGIHWGWTGHQAMADEVLRQLRIAEARLA